MGDGVVEGKGDGVGGTVFVGGTGKGVFDGIVFIGVGGTSAVFVVLILLRYSDKIIFMSSVIVAIQETLVCRLHASRNICNISLSCTEKNYSSS